MGKKADLAKPCAVHSQGLCAPGGDCPFPHDSRTSPKAIGVAVALRNFVHRKGGEMHGSGLAGFYKEHPEAKAAMYGRARKFCENHPDLIHCELANGSAMIRSVSLKKGWRSKPDSLPFAENTAASSSVWRGLALAKFVESRGGRMNTGLLNQFFADHPGAKTWFAAGVPAFCAEHPGLLRFERRGGEGVVICVYRDSQHPPAAELAPTIRGSSGAAASVTKADKPTERANVAKAAKSAEAHDRANEVAFAWKDHLDLCGERVLGQTRAVMKAEFNTFKAANRITGVPFSAAMKALRDQGYAQHGTWFELRETLALSLSSFVTARGGRVHVSALADFYDEYPESKSLLRGSLKPFCEKHSSLVRFDVNHLVAVGHIDSKASGNSSPAKTETVIETLAKPFDQHRDTVDVVLMKPKRGQENPPVVVVTKGEGEALHTESCDESTAHTACAPSNSDSDASRRPQERNSSSTLCLERRQEKDPWLDSNDPWSASLVHRRASITIETVPRSSGRAPQQLTAAGGRPAQSVEHVFEVEAAESADANARVKDVADEADDLDTCAAQGLGQGREATKNFYDTFKVAPGMTGVPPSAALKARSTKHGTWFKSLSSYVAARGGRIHESALADFYKEHPEANDFFHGSLKLLHFTLVRLADNHLVAVEQAASNSAETSGPTQTDAVFEASIQPMDEHRDTLDVVFIKQTRDPEIPPAVLVTEGEADALHIDCRDESKAHSSRISSSSPSDTSRRPQVQDSNSTLVIEGQQQHDPWLDSNDPWSAALAHRRASIVVESVPRSSGDVPQQRMITAIGGRPARKVELGSEVEAAAADSVEFATPGPSERSFNRLPWLVSSSEDAAEDRRAGSRPSAAGLPAAALGANGAGGTGGVREFITSAKATLEQVIDAHQRALSEVATMKADLDLAEAQLAARESRIEASLGLVSAREAEVTAREARVALRERSYEELLAIARRGSENLGRQ